MFVLLAMATGERRRCVDRVNRRLALGLDAMYAGRTSWLAIACDIMRKRRVTSIVDINKKINSSRLSEINNFVLNFDPKSRTLCRELI